MSLAPDELQRFFAGEPPTLPEEIVTAAWREALGVLPGSIDEDFFAAGGHSLLASEVAARLETVLGFDVPLTMVFDHPTIRRQAVWVVETANPRPAVASVCAPVLVQVISPRHLDRGALERACRQLAARVAAPERIGELDASRQPAAERRRSWHELVDHLARPFAAGAPVWRVGLARFGADRHLLVLAFAAEQFDASSARIVSDELYAAYRAARANGTPALPAARAGSSPEREPTQLADRLAPAPGFARLAGHRLGALLALGRGQHAPAAATLLAAVAVLVAKCTGKTEVVIGIPGARRLGPDARALIGPLGYVAPVAISLAGEPSFHALIDRAVVARHRGLAIGAGLGDAAPPGGYDAFVELADPPPVAGAGAGTDAETPWRSAAFVRRVERCDPASAIHVLAAWGAAGKLLVRIAAAALGDQLEALIDQLVARPGNSVSNLVAFAASAAPPSDDALAPAPPAPLSHAQERLWFVESLSPGTTVNHVQRVYRIKGRLDPSALERAIAAVAERHDILRTAFRVVDGAACQLVGPGSAGEHAMESIALGDPDDRARAIAERARAEYERPFDLARGPLWRTRLCTVAPDDHSLILTAHHIIIDAVSIHIWLRELSEHYRAIATGTRPRVPDITTTLRDIAIWERSDAGRRAIGDDLRFWVDELAGARSLDFPIDFKRPTTPSVGRHHVNTLVPPDRVAELRALGRRCGATLNTALIAAAFAFLSRLTGQDDLVCVVPSTNRHDRDRANLIGLLLNLLPLRLRLDGDPTFAEIIARTDRAMRVALRHGDAPFERIAAGAGIAREPGRQPLFDVTLNMVPGIDWFRSGGLRYSQESVKNTAQPCDMVISASTKLGGMLDLVLRCRADLFAAVSAERMLRRFASMLLAGTARPELRLSELPFVPDEERALVVETWNQTRVPLPDTTVPELVGERLRRTPDAVAVRQGDRVMTAGELAHRASALARRLRARGGAPGTPIGVAIPPSPELAVAALGVMQAGATYVPFDAAQPAARIEMLAREVAFVIDPSDVIAADGAVPDDDPLPAVSPDAPSYIVFTSGSTGQPKSLSTTHRALVNQILWFRRDLPWQPDEVACWRSSPAFADSLWEIFGPLADGVPLAIATSDEMRDPRLLAALIARERVTRLQVVPSLLHALLELGARDPEFLPSVALWLSTSEELKPALVRRFFALRPSSRLVNLYGCSETGAEVSAFEVTAPDPVRTPIGRPIANTRIYVLDGAGRPQPAGVYGELHISGAGVSEAYRNAPALSAERFPPDPFVAGARMYRSGDRGRWRHDGQLEYVGRIDHVLKIRGVRIDPGEVENAILAHPEIAAAIVTAVPGSDGEPRLVAHLVPRPRARLDHAELRRFLRARLPETMIPTSLVAVDQLPLGPTGKVDRARLPQPSFTGAASRAPHGAVEHAVALVWEQLLGHAPGAEDDFFAAGGQSLLAAQLGARLGERFGVELPLPVLFERPTIAAQAAWIEDATRSGTASGIPRVAGDRPAPLSFAQERLWFSSVIAPSALEPRLRYVLRLEGPLDAARLDAAMVLVAERHDTLRTVFAEDASGVTQRVVATCPRDHVFEDASRVPVAEHDAAIRAHLAADRARGFDLRGGPPWRTRLLRLRADLHVLVVTFHHLVADGVSIQIWLEEVDEHYRALAAGIAPALPPLAVSASDVATWQRRMVDSTPWHTAREFWRRTLAGASPVDLPTVAARTGWSSGAGGRVRADLSTDDAAGIAARALAEQTTLFGFLVAGVSVLVHELTGRTDVTMGTIVAGRDRPEVRSLMGLFLNPLPLRTELSGDPELRELVRRTGATIRAALAHGDLPFEHIVADVNPERRPYRQPFFDIVVNHHPPGFPPRLGDLRVGHLRGMAAPVAPYELMFRAVSHPNGLTVQLDFQRDRFAEDVVRGWLDRYVAILHLMMAEPERRLITRA
jgi:amino acid adenylation domain-containing protein